ncbi:hypothetical protein [Algibacter sp. PT7-4]|uniref:hypothetical protein n=1 Tax=Algibacter ulvanivorans TaxID=3400999 RepID=UPI003AAC934F
MKKNLAVVFCSIVISCLFSFLGNAQKQKSKFDTFDLEIIKYSDKPDADKVHYHLIQLTNNSNKTIEFNLFVKEVKCNQANFDVVKNQKGIIDNFNDVNKPKANKNKSSLLFEIYNESMNNTMLDKISLKTKESIKLYLKITRKDNSEIGQLKCTKIIAKPLNNKENKIKKSVVIKTFIADSNIQGQ